MIQLDFKTRGFSDRLGAMLTNIKEAQHRLDSEMLDWQAQDMRRKRPFLVKESDPTSVATKIWSRSRLDLMKRRWTWAKENKGRRRRQSARPILRQILVVKLVERMKGMLKETLKWQ
jgi:hypothetical protein